MLTALTFNPITNLTPCLSDSALTFFLGVQNDGIRGG